MSFGEHETVPADEPVGRKAARGVVGLSIGRMVSMAMQLVVFAILAGHLGEAGVGLFGFGLAIAALFDVVANLGFKQVVTRDISQHPDRESWLIPNYVYLRFLLGLAAYAGLVAFVVVAGYGPDEREAALIGGLLLILTSPQATQPVLEVRLRMGVISIADVVEATILLLGTIVLVSSDAGVTAFLWLFLAANLVNSLLILAAALRARRGLDWRPRPRRWGPVTRSAVVLGIASVLISVYYQIDIALLARLKPDADVGNYAAAARALTAVGIVPVVLSTVLAPVLARTVAAPRAVQQRRYSLAVHLMTVAGVAVAVGGAMTGWRFLPIVPGFDAFGRGGVALSILSLAGGLIFVGVIVQAMLVAAHLQRRLVSIALLGLVINLGLNLLTIPTFSLYGAAAATVATETIVLWRSHQVVHHELGLRWPVARTARLVIPTGAMAAVGLATSWLPVGLQMGLMGSTYVVLVLATGTLRVQDLASLRTGGEGTLELSLDGSQVEEPDDGAVTRTRVEGRMAPVRAALAGVETAHLHSTGPVRLGALLGARLAGVSELIVHRGVDPGALERWRLHLVADEIRSHPRSRLLFVNEGGLGTGILGHLAALESVMIGLHEAGADPDLVVVGGPERWWERLLARGVPLVGRFDIDLQASRWHAVMAWRTRRAVGHRPDPERLLVLAHTIGFGLLPMMRRTPSFVWVDATARQWIDLQVWRPRWPWSYAAHWWSLRRERAVFRTATVLAYSEWAAAGVRAEVPDARVVVHSPGIDIEQFSPPVDGDADADPNDPVRILFVGGRFRGKGGHDLLAATEGLRPGRVVLDVVTGDDIADGPGLTVHRLSGGDPRLVELYRRAQLFCLPTHADCSPFVVLEALATGNPVISTRVGAVPSLVGEAGRIVEIGDIDALRDAIVELVDDEPLRREMAVVARRRAEAAFSARRQGRKLIDLLELERTDA